MAEDQLSNDAAAEVLLRAGARVCGQCGKQSSIQANDDVGALWFCFECGHEERQMATSAGNGAQD